MSSWLLQAGPGGGAILAGSRCAVCRQAIFSLWLGTGARCGVCSFLVCRHCSTQVTAARPPRTRVSCTAPVCPLIILANTRQAAARSTAALQGTGMDGAVCWGWGLQQLGPSPTLIVVLCTAPAVLQCARCSLLGTSNIFRNSNQVHPVAVRGTQFNMQCS